MSENHEVHALSGAYSLDALDEEERRRFEAHLLDCLDCTLEVAEFHETAAALADLVAASPGPNIRESLLASVAETRQEPPIVALASRRHAARGESRGGWGAWRRPVVAAAAAVVVALAGTAAITQPWHSGDAPQAVPTTNSPSAQPSNSDRVLAAADAVRAKATLTNGATVQVVRSASMGQSVLVADNLPAPAPGRVYQVWLQDASGALTPAGLLPRSRSMTMMLEDEAMSAMGLGLTEEPAGGSEQPTTTPLAMIAMPT